MLILDPCAILPASERCHLLLPGREHIVGMHARCVSATYALNVLTGAQTPSGVHVTAAHNHCLTLLLL